MAITPDQYRRMALGLVEGINGTIDYIIAKTGTLTTAEILALTEVVRRLNVSLLEACYIVAPEAAKEFKERQAARVELTMFTKPDGETFH